MVDVSNSKPALAALSQGPCGFMHMANMFPLFFLKIENEHKETKNKFVHLDVFHHVTMTLQESTIVKNIHIVIHEVIESLSLSDCLLTAKESYSYPITELEVSNCLMKVHLR